VTFAHRGKAARNEALEKAMGFALQSFIKSTGKDVQSRSVVISNYPNVEPCLQALDYYLWALQRLYERHEEHYFDFVRAPVQTGH